MVDQSFLKLCLSHIGHVWTDNTSTGIGQQLMEEQLNWQWTFLWQEINQSQFELPKSFYSLWAV